MKKYFIGVDNGGTYIKASLFDINGDQVGQEKLKNDTTVYRTRQVEVDPDSLWRRNCQCISNLITNSKIPAEHIENISIAGQGKGLYIVDKQGRAIRSAITSADSRAWEIVKKWHEEGIADEIYQYTFQGLFASHPVSILRWLKENEPENYKRINWIFSMKDYLVYKMTNTAVGDYCNQSGNSYMNLNTGRYEPEIFKLLGIEDMFDKLPPLHYSAEVCGVVTEEAALQMGCLPGTKVLTGMFDVDASALGMGLVTGDRIGIIAGTCGINAYIAKEPVRNHSVLMNSYYCIPGYYYIEEGSNTSAGIIEWVIDTLFAEEKKSMGDNIYEYLDEIVQSKGIEENELCFLPYLYGSALNSRSTGVWSGLTPLDDKRDMLRACYEGIVFTHRWHVDRLLKNMEKPKAVRLAGGIVHSKVWVQLFADILKIPIEIIDAQDIGGYGLAIAAGIAAGEHADYRDAVEKCIRIKATIYPDRTAAEVYDKKYQNYTCLADKLECI